MSIVRYLFPGPSHLLSAPTRPNKLENKKPQLLLFLCGAVHTVIGWFTFAYKYIRLYTYIYRPMPIIIITTTTIMVSKEKPKSWSSWRGGATFALGVIFVGKTLGYSRELVLTWRRKMTFSSRWYRITKGVLSLRDKKDAKIRNYITNEYIHKSVINFLLLMLTTSDDLKNSGWFLGKFCAKLSLFNARCRKVFFNCINYKKGIHIYCAISMTIIPIKCNSNKWILFFLSSD